MNLAAARSWMTRFDGGARSVALMRIGFALIGWSEFGFAAEPHRGSIPLAIFFFVSSFLMLVGVYARLTTLAAGIAYLLVIIHVPGQMMQHTYLLAVSTMLLALTPCGASISIDRWRAVRKAKATGAPVPPEHGNLWGLRLIGIALSAVLFWSGYDKITFGTQHFQTAFLSGDRIEQMLAYYYSLPIQEPGLVRLLFLVVGCATVLFEMAASVLLWVPRVRLKVLLACFVMTSAFQLVLAIRAFGLLSYVLYLAFVPPDLVDRAIEILLGHERPRAGSLRARPEESSSE